MTGSRLTAQAISVNCCIPLAKQAPAGPGWKTQFGKLQ